MKTKLFILIILLLFAGCSLKKSATTMTAKIVTDGMKAVESETDLWIAKDSIVPMVKTLEVFSAGDPDNQKFLALMSKVYGNVAFGFFEPKYLSVPSKEKPVWRERIERYYKKGSDAGMRSLSRRFGKGINGSIMEFEKAVSKAKQKDLMLLFWTAFDLGNLVNLNKSDITSVASMPKVSALIDKVVEIDRGFGYGSALAFQAAILASRPKMLGGNPEKAQEIFEEAVLVQDGNYLMSKVMFAEWYAIPRGDKALARKLLKEVVDSDPYVLKEQALANKLAIERAEILMRNY